MTGREPARPGASYLIQVPYMTRLNEQATLGAFDGA
jgi:hypothetical protein